MNSEDVLPDPRHGIDTLQMVTTSCLLLIFLAASVMVCLTKFVPPLVAITNRLCYFAHMGCLLPLLMRVTFLHGLCNDAILR